MKRFVRAGFAGRRSKTESGPTAALQRPYSAPTGSSAPLTRLPKSPTSEYSWRLSVNSQHVTPSPVFLFFFFREIFCGRTKPPFSILTPTFILQLTSVLTSIRLLFLTPLPIYFCAGCFFLRSRFLHGVLPDRRFPIKPRLAPKLWLTRLPPPHLRPR